MVENKKIMAVCDFSRDGCLKFLSSPEAAQDWRNNNLELINRHAKHLLPAILPEYRKKKTEFLGVEGLGGESTVVRAFDKICQRETTFKVAFPDANLKGTRTVYHEESIKKTRVEHFNIIRERFIRGGAQIAGALADIINRKYGIIPQIRTACDFPVFVEMEFLEGQHPLRYYHKKDFRERFEFFYRLLVFVGIVHSYKIIHRDFKPSNVLVIETDEWNIPAILDWTFAKQMNVETEDDVQFGLTQQSNMNFHIHSPCFSSPRLIDGGGENADYQDDIYSLGQMMYCLFTGTLPKSLKDFITRETPVRLGDRVLPASPLPPDFIEIYKRATHIDEVQRFKTVSEFLVALEGFASKINISPPAVNIPEFVQDGFQEFVGTQSKSTPKTEETEKHYKLERRNPKTVIIDLGAIADEKSRKMVADVVEIAIAATRYNVILKKGIEKDE